MKKVLLIALTMTSLSTMGVYTWRQWLFGINPNDLIDRGTKLAQNARLNEAALTYLEAIADLRDNTTTRMMGSTPELNKKMQEKHEKEQKIHEFLTTSPYPLVDHQFLADYNKIMAGRYKEAHDAQEMIEERTKKWEPVDAPTEDA